MAYKIYSSIFSRIWRTTWWPVNIHCNCAHCLRINPMPRAHRKCAMYWIKNSAGTHSGTPTVDIDTNRMWCVECILLLMAVVIQHLVCLTCADWYLHIVVSDAHSYYSSSIFAYVHVTLSTGTNHPNWNEEKRLTLGIEMQPNAHNWFCRSSLCQSYLVFNCKNAVQPCPEQCGWPRCSAMHIYSRAAIGLLQLQSSRSSYKREGQDGRKRMIHHKW